MNVVYFTHSLKSCWNHGNAHFLRGVLRELVAAGHSVAVFEPQDAWSLQNLLTDQGESAVALFGRHYPELEAQSYGSSPDLDAMLDTADVVIVHEWNAPALVAAIGRRRKSGARFTLLFHDTHHRAVSDPAAMRRFDLSGYDAVLAFGEALAEVYRRWGWGRRVFTWHEAADTNLFRPPAIEGDRRGVVWIGNWGDGERTAELEAFLLCATAQAGMPLTVHGVRYPARGRLLLAGYGAAYRGWLANPQVPDVFARHLATVHVPRRFYASVLPGIPTIRVFEALACGIPLVCAPWDDAEHLFRPGMDFLVAQDSAEMTRHLAAIRDDAALRTSLVDSGRETIATRHTCRHRVDELMRHLRTIGSQPVAAAECVA